MSTNCIQCVINKRTGGDLLCDTCRKNNPPSDSTNPSHPAWAEYSAAAEYMAKRGLKGKRGDPLPMNMSPEAVELINDDPEAFENEVKLHAYTLAMEHPIQPDNYVRLNQIIQRF